MQTQQRFEADLGDHMETCRRRANALLGALMDAQQVPVHTVEALYRRCMELADGAELYAEALRNVVLLINRQRSDG